MSKERARRREARLAGQATAREDRARADARRQRRRTLLSRLVPRRPDRRVGRVDRWSRAERSTAAGLTLAALGVIWTLIHPLALQVALTLVLLLAAPAIITVARRRL
ncbi:hypothetical protein [Pilimelia columellifera]|uniref:Uncharacterized protein n=1 Tax=Pilimelia columellifera subsp. columellifera TaxID=706583 RepID=A0ABN3N9F5_9ACTN